MWEWSWLRLTLMHGTTHIFNQIRPSSSECQKLHRCHFNYTLHMHELYILQPRPKTQGSKIFIWPLFRFSQIAYNTQLHKFIIDIVKATSIKTTCGRWHGSLVYRLSANVKYFSFNSTIHMDISPWLSRTWISLSKTQLSELYVPTHCADLCE